MLTIFTVTLLIMGAMMSLITGSARLLLVREAWLFLVVGLWILGTVPTKRPFLMTMGRSTGCRWSARCSGWSCWAGPDSVSPTTAS